MAFVAIINLIRRFMEDVRWRLRVGKDVVAYRKTNECAYPATLSEFTEFTKQDLLDLGNIPSGSFVRDWNSSSTLGSDSFWSVFEFQGTDAENPGVGNARQNLRYLDWNSLSTRQQVKCGHEDLMTFISKSSIACYSLMKCNRFIQHCNLSSGNFSRSCVST